MLDKNKNTKILNIACETGCNCVFCSNSPHTPELDSLHMRRAVERLCDRPVHSPPLPYLAVHKKCLRSAKQIAAQISMLQFFALAGRIRVACLPARCLPAYPSPLLCLPFAHLLGPPWLALAEHGTRTAGHT